MPGWPQSRCQSVRHGAGRKSDPVLYCLSSLPDSETGFRLGSVCFVVVACRHVLDIFGGPQFLLRPSLSLTSERYNFQREVRTIVYEVDIIFRSIFGSDASHHLQPLSAFNQLFYK